MSNDSTEYVCMYVCTLYVCTYRIAMATYNVGLFRILYVLCTQMINGDVCICAEYYNEERCLSLSLSLCVYVQ